MFKRGGRNEEDYKGVLACVRLYHKSLGWALVLLAFLGLCVTPAYARTEEVILADQIAFVPNSNVVKSGWLVLAYNDFNAAVLVIGQNPQDYRLDLDVRAKLSNASTGGAFYTLVQAMNDATATGVDMPTWAEGTYSAFGSLWGGIAQSSDMGLYWCEVAPEDIEAAKRDYLIILHGGDLGGGGGSGGDTGDVPNVYTGNPQLYTNNVSTSQNQRFDFIVSEDGTNYICKYTTGTFSGDTTLPIGPFPITIILPSNIPEFSYDGTYDFICTLEKYGEYAKPKFRYIIYALENGSYTINYLDNSNGTKYFSLSNIQFNKQTTVYYLETSGSFMYTYNNGTFDFSSGTYSGNTWRTRSVGISSGLTGSPHGLSASYVSTTTSTPVIPPSNWPENPTDPTPTPPTVPTPTPVVPSPYITQPTYSEGSFTVDLQGILDAMDEHCQHLQDAIYDNVSGYYDSMSGYLGTEFYNLKMYLKQLFEWLASQMDFTFTAPGYNDSSVVSWLKRIYSRLGSRGVNTKPVDPVSDPVGIGDWFAQLMKNFIGALLGIGSTAVDGLIDELSALRDRFPFCIPWDIAAILLLLVAPPVAPAFDVPLYTVTANGLEQVGEFAIDLSVFDTEMVGIRNMETIVFAFCLAFKTDFFKGLLDVRKG